MKPTLDAILDQPWALAPTVLRQLTAYLSGDTTVHAAVTAQPAEPRQAQGYISVIPVHGVIERRSSFLAELFGVGSSVETLRAQFRAALADPDVRGIVLDIDSPGGGVGGVTELAEEVRAVRGQKPIYALADTTAASAAYWLGAQAERFYVVPSGEVGSVGVYAVHMDISRALDAEGITPTIVSAGERKTAETELEPLSDEARAAIQSRVDAHYTAFVADVAKGRGVSTDTVRATFGEGGLVLPKDAVAAGMVDGIETLDGVLRLMGRAIRRGTRAEGAGAEVIAEHDDPIPFRERVAMLRSDADAVAAHALVRQQLRAKEGRPPFSDEVLDALRATRDAISSVLPGEPAAPLAAVDPPPPVQPAPAIPAPAPAVARFRSRDEWIDYLRTS